MNVPVNVVDRPDLSSFIFPSIVDRGDVVVAIGSGGTSPVLARRLREKIEQILPERIGEFAALMGRKDAVELLEAAE
jgi:uroporphyrin-III C-methyltransferase/precorrin-2 dehydrogenase/sirohydrochlorin ferrochelatase